MGSGKVAVVAPAVTSITKLYLENILVGVVIMLALSYASQNTFSACSSHAERMPASQPTHSTCMGMAATTSATSTTIIETDVLASAFLFVVVHLVCSLLLGLVALINLLLIGLTGLVSLESLVGHSVVRLETHRTQGD
jgi:hypothetical protein